MKTITVTKDIVSKYETNDIIHFVGSRCKTNLKQMEDALQNEDLGSIGAAWANLAYYINILDELDKKLNGDNSVNLL